MSRPFNTAQDRISKQQMYGFAKVLLRREPSLKEQMAAVAAIRAFRNGAPFRKVHEAFFRELSLPLRKGQS